MKPGKTRKPSQNPPQTLPATLPPNPPQTLQKPSRPPSPPTLQKRSKNPPNGGRPSAAPPWGGIWEGFWKVWGGGCPGGGGFGEGLGGGRPGGFLEGLGRVFRSSLVFLDLAGLGCPKLNCHPRLEAAVAARARGPNSRPGAAPGARPGTGPGSPFT